MSNNFFTEATRVQMPALVHLTRLGYKYYGKISESQSGIDYDDETNILIKEFERKFDELNPDHIGEAQQVLHDIKKELDDDDLGKSFYNRLIRVSPIKLIDFENPENNSYYFTAEFTCKNGEDEFRPDITLFINGMPLVFIEVKKPNNKGGMLAESNRMIKTRFPNRKFRRFINITQLMIFSNNMEYDSDGGIIPIEGVFYCTGARGTTKFNCFREDNKGDNEIAPYNKEYPYYEINVDEEKKILTDFNCQVIHNSPEYQTNLNIYTPTNRTLTSMCSKERLLFLLKYGITYVKMEREVDGEIESIDQKHIMRYQQMFAALETLKKIKEGVKSGVIWHTQGSGKTALSYNLSYVLKDYFAMNNKVAKFYFIVDRIDLLEQAKQEFEARGVKVQTASSREDLMNQFSQTQAQEGASGEHEIIVVNIQKFEEDHAKVEIPEYATNLQRIFIIDEAHRGYNPTGSFLANLLNADANAIKIALTGTPLLKEERESWRIFGNYIHTYYYDKSIQDGYTLKIIREDVETSYKEKLSQIYESLENLVQKKDIKKSQIIEHDKYVEELLRYIINDIKQFRFLQNDNSLGGMVICETSEQARKLYLAFNKIQDELNDTEQLKSNLKVGLILYDSGDKEEQKQIIKDFKKNMTIDILIVYNMLLTGFDAPRLKRLYFGRKLKDHNLLQAITRVNRPYKENKYGYIIDFADIKKNFDETNEAYLRELNRFNNPEETGMPDMPNLLNQVIVNKEEMIQKIKEIEQFLFNFTTDNAEIFSSEIETIEEKRELIELKRVLNEAKDYYNVIRTFGDDELKQTINRIDLSKLPQMLSEVQHRIDIINQKEMFSQDDDVKILVNEAMEDITFRFAITGEEEMVLTSGTQELQDKFKRTVHAFTQNIDQDDPEYITIREAFVRRFKEHGFVVNNIDEFNEHTRALDEIMSKLKELQNKNKVLVNKYNGDIKFARVHKRILEENERRKAFNKEILVSNYDVDIMQTLKLIKDDIDQKVYDRNDILKQDAYFERTVMQQISEGMDKLNVIHTREDREFIRDRITKQYLQQYKETYPEAA